MSKLEFSLKLSKVKIDEFNFKEPDEIFIKKFNEELLKIGLGLNFSHNIEEELLSVHLSIAYDYINEEEEVNVKMLEFKGTFEFNIIDLKKIIGTQEGTINIPNFILETILSISISSSRGIIIAKTAGSFINTFYLPLFNPQILLKDFNKKGEDEKIKKTL